MLNFISYIFIFSFFWCFLMVRGFMHRRSLDIFLRSWIVGKEASGLESSKIKSVKNEKKVNRDLTRT